MSPADLERLFDPFVQLDSPSTRSAASVGLGLHIVRRLSEAHGGATVVDQLDGRVSFHVRVPGAAEAHAVVA